jgi:hypothetical protein
VSNTFPWEYLGMTARASTPSRRSTAMSTAALSLTSRVHLGAAAEEADEDDFDDDIADLGEDDLEDDFDDDDFDDDDFDDDFDDDDESLFGSDE